MCRSSPEILPRYRPEPAGQTLRCRPQRIQGAGAASVWSPPLGHFRLSPAAPFVAVVLGPLPVQTSFVVPSSLPIGAPLYWQGFALGANGGNLTGLADVVVR